jgi:hypothetical protein
VVEIVHRNSSQICKFMINNRQVPLSALNEVLGGNGGVVPRILYVCARFSGSVSFMPWSLYRRGSCSCYPFTRWLGGPQIGSLLLREEQNRKYLPLPGILPQLVGCPTGNLVTVPAELLKIRVFHSLCRRWLSVQGSTRALHVSVWVVRPFRFVG